MIYNVVFSINKDYLLFAMVTLYSLLKNNKQHNFNIYIQHNNCITEQDIESITAKNPLRQYDNFKIILLDVSEINFINESTNKAYWTKEVLFKIFLPEMLPSCKKALYLDVDLIVKGDISKIYEVEMNNIMFLGDTLHSNGDIGINGGVLLMNLEMAREDNMTKKIVEYMKANPSCTEEEAINKNYKDQIIFSSEYIYTVSTKRKRITKKYLLNNIVIIHYVARKPWVMSPFRKYGIVSTGLWYNYLKGFSNNKLQFHMVSFYNIYLARIVFSVSRGIRKIFIHNTDYKIKYKLNNFLKNYYDNMLN